MPRAIYEDSEPLLRPASGFAAARTLVPNAPTMVQSNAALKTAALVRQAPPSVYQTPPVMAPIASTDAALPALIGNALVPNPLGIAGTIIGAVGKTSPPSTRTIGAIPPPPSFGGPPSTIASPKPLPGTPAPPPITTGLVRSNPPAGTSLTLASAASSPLLLLAAAAVAVWLLFRK